MGQDLHHCMKAGLMMIIIITGITKVGCTARDLTSYSALNGGQADDNINARWTVGQATYHCMEARLMTIQMPDVLWDRQLTAAWRLG